jgi:hypothetical protein
VVAAPLEATKGILNQIKLFSLEKLLAVKIRNKKKQSKQIDYGERIGRRYRASLG